jgi:branched-chain amino acid transport system ATP-binding protein
MSVLLRTQGLAVSYGVVEAVHPLDLHVDEGEIVTVIGPNGAGKSTLLGALMGLLPSRGALHFDGAVVPRPTVEAMVARGVGLVPEKRELFGEMSVEDNLLLGGFARWRRGQRDQKARMQEVFAIFPRLEERRAQLASTLSGGERQMLAIGRALMARPRLLMLDEPSLGLAPLIVREVLRVVASLRGAAWRSCWSSRTRARRCRWPTAPTCWRWARWRSAAPPKTCSPPCTA